MKVALIHTVEQPCPFEVAGPSGSHLLRIGSFEYEYNYNFYL